MVGSSKVAKIHRAVFLLSLLKADNNEPIMGRTKLEKMVFLIDKEILNKTPFKGNSYEFDAYKFGPFSTELLDDVELMRDMGYLERDTSGNDVIYKITETGKEKIEQITKKVPNNIKKQLDDIERQIEKIKQRNNKLQLKALVTYVHQKYPRYTVNSEIKNKILY